VSTVLLPAVSFAVDDWMPEMGLSSVKEACDVKSLRGIQYLDDWLGRILGYGRELNEGEWADPD
jgi:hypothetical protein